MKLSVNNDQMTSGFFEDARIIGIVAPMKDYQFTWNVNTSMLIDFRINPEIEIVLSRKNRDYFFSVFEYIDPVGNQAHYLYNNQYDGEYLLPEFRNMDFLWLVKGAHHQQLIEALVDAVRLLPITQLVTEISCDKIIHKSHLVF